MAKVLARSEDRYVPFGALVPRKVGSSAVSFVMDNPR